MITMMIFEGIIIFSVGFVIGYLISTKKAKDEVPWRENYHDHY